MERNLSWRVEVVAPVVAPALRQRLWEILEINLNDRRQAWMMTASGDTSASNRIPTGTVLHVEGTQATLMHLRAAAALTEQ